MRNDPGVDAQKRAAAEAAVAQIQDGMIVGLGTGSTALLALDALAKRVRQGLRVTGVPTSEHIAARARELKIVLTTLNDHAHLDLDVDGADEVERGSLNLIKGKGGALLREKIVAAASKRFIVIADQSKLVNRLGEKTAIPVEVARFGWKATAEKVEALGGRPALRHNADGSEFLSDGGNFILDCSFGPIADSQALARELDSIVGVIEHGLFLGMASVAIIGEAGGVSTHEVHAPGPIMKT
ncbi:MAG TPA: ribose-5-phosphate isomerase RpiA [Bryobacteraceae bacterium]